jgi:adenylosuccinate lyase
MRKHGVEDAYEQIKAATQTQQLDAAAIRRLVEATAIPEPDRSRLISLTPAGFIGAAAEIARAVLDRE